MSGPYCTMMLGDMGADIIKIERPGQGDDTRSWLPPAIGGESAYYLSANRNKRSVTLDLKEPAALEVLWRLIEGADVVAENFSPGTAARLGFGYDAVRERKPDMVYLSISGFGQEGPARDRTAYDLIVQGMSGLMTVTGPPGEPTRFGIPIADIAAGMFAAYAVLGALFHRERTGEGQRIDASMFAGQVALLTYQAGIHFATGETPRGAARNAHPIIAPYQTFRSRDGYINIAVGNDAIWRRFCPALGLEGLLGDARWAANEGRIAGLAELSALIEARTSQLDTAELVRLLDAAAVPCGPILTVPQALAHPQVDEYGLRRRVPHPALGEVELTGFPYALGATPCELRLPPPELGQHTAEVLAELGYSAEQREALEASGAI
jgi:crotonobetainyl-CoA:carnitine CoA-transferase CaiB-like acyl-CoA transferase